MTERLRRAVAPAGREHDLDGRLHVGAPCRVDGERARPGRGSKPGADGLAVEDQRRPRAAPCLWPLAAGDERTVRDAGGGDVEDRAQVKGETGATRMVAARRVDEEDVRAREVSHRGLEHGAVAQGEEPCTVGPARPSGDDVLGDEPAALDNDRRRPEWIARGTRAGDTAPLGDEAPGDRELSGSRAPRGRPELAQRLLCRGERPGLVRPAPLGVRLRARSPAAARGRAGRRRARRSRCRAESRRRSRRARRAPARSPPPPAGAGWPSRRTRGRPRAPA